MSGEEEEEELSSDEDEEDTSRLLSFNTLKCTHTFVLDLEPQQTPPSIILDNNANNIIIIIINFLMSLGELFGSQCEGEHLEHLKGFVANVSARRKT